MGPNGSSWSALTHAARWVDEVAPLELAVTCGDSVHTVRWEGGALVLVDHGDLDAELALVAFGGDEPACLAQFGLWNDAISDGGFLGEWVDDDLDESRLWWLRMALERMRSEGFHEFLRELPPSRAARMAQFLTRFPAPWLDLAAAGVAEAVIDGPGVTCDRAADLFPPAIARRLRKAFVTSVGGRQVALGGAALVPFRPVVDPVEPFAEGVIQGRASQVTIGVGQRWLFDVWGAGAAVVDGHLVLGVERHDQQSEATIIVWHTDGRRAEPTIEQRPLLRHGNAWHLGDLD